jgi:hypothetical protein
MASTFTVGGAAERHFFESDVRNHQHSSGVSWSAVIGGAFVAAAVSLIMLALGAGFGLSAVSPWSNSGVPASAVGTGALIWLVFTQVICYGLGGYLTGRLRTKWVSVHTDEVYFRDTANGFLAWAVALVVTVSFLVAAASTMAGQRDVSKSPADPGNYFVDRLFRADNPVAQPVDQAARAEAGRILANTLRQNDASGADLAYLGKLVAAKTGMSEADASNRVSQTVADARQAEDTARQTASRFLLWLFLALLTGAFSASLAATVGGRQRDHMKAI